MNSLKEYSSDLVSLAEHCLAGGDGLNKNGYNLCSTVLVADVGEALKHGICPLILVVNDVTANTIYIAPHYKETSVKVKLVLFVF